MLSRPIPIVMMAPILFLCLSVCAPIRAQGEGKPGVAKFGRIQPPGGVPLFPGRPGIPISTEYIRKATERLDATPEADFAKWVAELERITGKELDSDLEVMGCRTYFVTRVSLAYDDLRWNAKSADHLFKRAQTLTASEARIWKEAFETVLKKEIERPYQIPLLLMAVNSLHPEQQYSPERGKKYLARLKQLTVADVNLWSTKADQFGGTELDSAVNLTLLDSYFEQEQFQRDKFRAALEAR